MKPTKEVLPFTIILLAVHINHLNVSWNGVRTLKQNQSLLMVTRTSYFLNKMDYQNKQLIIKAC